MRVLQTKKYSINFQANLRDWEYSGSYRDNKNLNGRKFDKFIINRIKSQSGVIFVSDWGAGQGRNTIPLAEMGYNLTAIEMNEVGCSQIYVKAKNRDVLDKVKILNENIFSKIKLEKKSDFAFMSHVTQNLDIDELQVILENISKNLKKGKELIFDALIRKKANYQGYDRVPAIIKRVCFEYAMDKYGAASFNREDILNAAKQAGLTFIQEAPFKEAFLNRAKYEKQNLWGGFRPFEFLVGIPRKPVKLAWFVFRK